MQEEWKDIPGWEGYYQVSNFGQVKAVKRSILGRDGVVQNKRERILNQITNEQGRYKVNLCRDSVKKTYKVHVLVALAFLGEKPENKVVCHNDGNHQNNYLDNLRYDTRKGNMADRRIHGTHYQGSQMPWSILNEQQVSVIKQRLVQGDSQSSLARKYGVHKATIGLIANNTNWRHVPWPE